MLREQKQSYAGEWTLAEAPARHVAAPASLEVSKVTFGSYADVEALDQEWLWEGKIPRGDVTLLGGDSGIGKGFFMADLAARISRGDVMPDGTPGPAAGHVVMITPEDDASTSTAWRLRSAHADLTMVHDLTMVQGAPWTVDDAGLGTLRELITLCGGARLVVIDPLGAVTPVSLAADVTVRRRIIDPLRAVARDTGCAILIVHHLTKSGAAASARTRTAAKDGLGGSKGLTNVIRSMLSVTRDKNDPRIRTVDVVKSNMAEDGAAPVRYTLRGEWPDTHVVYLAAAGDVTDTADAAAGQDALLEDLRASDCPRDGQALAVATGIDYPAARILLRRLMVQQLVTSPSRGLFEAVASEQGKPLAVPVADPRAVVRRWLEAGGGQLADAVTATGLSEAVVADVLAELTDAGLAGSKRRLANPFRSAKSG
jgi:hypothetical protein